MTQLGEGVHCATIAVDDVEGINVLFFKLVDANGKPLRNIPYKLVKSGASAEPTHLAQGKTNSKGKTTVASTTNDEEIDFYVTWAKLKMNKGFLKD